MGCAAGVGMPAAVIMWMAYATDSSYALKRLAIIFGVGEEAPYYPRMFVEGLLDGSRLLGKNPGISDTFMLPRTGLLHSTSSPCV